MFLHKIGYQVAEKQLPIHMNLCCTEELYELSIYPLVCCGKI